MKIIFFGSDDFARTHLDALISSKHQVAACVTQPDRPKGRGMKVVQSPIKTVALEHNIDVMQPENVKTPEFFNSLECYKADLFVVIAYGRILPQTILNIPKIFSINVHGSLLPKYRGAAPINWAIIQGEKETGLSIIKMNAKMDAGEILSQAKIVISADMTAVELRQEMMLFGAKLLLRTINDIENNQLTLIPQDEGRVSYAAKLTKELGRIDWGKPADEIHNLVRGLQPWPNSYTFFRGKALKILKSSPISQVNSSVNPGKVVAITAEGIVVATGRGALLIKEVHLEASQRMDTASFLRGHKIEAGYRFE